MKIRVVGFASLLILSLLFSQCSTRVLTRTAQAGEEISSEQLIQSEPSNTQLPPPPLQSIK